MITPTQLLRGLMGGGLALALLLVAVPAHAQQNIFEGCSPELNMLTHAGPYLGGKEKGSVTTEVHIRCDNLSIFADEITWDGKMATASGRLLVIQEGFRITAARAVFNRETRLGVFYDAYGTARISDQPAEPSLFGSLEPEIIFQAETLAKTGPRTYKITNGWFSTCVQPNPRWAITGSSGTITLDERVVLRNSVLRVKGVPVIYIPFIYYPLGEDDRSTGLLIPTYSTSSVRGQGLSNAYFLALGRSHDATLFHDYFSKEGHGIGGEYRFRPAEASSGEVNFYMMNRRARFREDGTLERDASRYYELRGHTNQRFPRGFQLVGNVNYFSDAATQQLYQQNIYDFSRRDRRIDAQLSKDFSLDRTTLRFSGRYERQEVFTGLDSAQRFGRAPEIKLSLNDRPLNTTQPGSFLSRVSVGGNAEVVNFQNRLDINDRLTDRGVWRFDGAPTVRATLSPLDYLYVTTAASWRLTRWSDSIDPLTGDPASVALNRSLLDLRADVAGPILERIWKTPKNGYAEGFRHRIEPRIGVQWLSAFDRFNQVVRNDYTDQQVGGTTTINYSLTNKLSAKVKQDGGASNRDILIVTVQQSYYSNALAGQFDTNYQGATQGSFSPIQVRVIGRPQDRVDGQFQMYIDSDTRAIMSYSATAGLSSDLTEFRGGWSRRLFLPDVPGFDNPAGATHFLDAAVKLRTKSRRFSGEYGLNYDVKSRGFLNQRVVVGMNAQCCGVSVDYQTVALGHLALAGLQQDRRFGISFTLAGIGSFSNPMGAFGNNTGRR